MNEFNVLRWDFNEPTPTSYDVLPYFRERYSAAKKEKRPITKEQWKEFIKQWGIYMYSSRCEYEVLVGRWPPTKESYKIDIWMQIKCNLDLIAEILMKEHEGNSK